jgi:hypothetical protein
MPAQLGRISFFVSLCYRLALLGTSLERYSLQICYSHQRGCLPSRWALKDHLRLWAIWLVVRFSQISIVGVFKTRSVSQVV